MRIVCLIGFVLAGCAAPLTQYQRLAALETPAAWREGGAWTFHVVGTHRQDIGDLTLRLTDQAAQTCNGDGWRRAEVLATSIESPPLNHWSGAGAGTPGPYPAYLIEGRNLWLLLNAPICDNDWTMRGALKDHGAEGTFGTEGMLGGERLGTFVATKSR